MTDRLVLVPHAGHPITITRNPEHVVVRAGDTVIADAREALTLQEANYPPVQYIPRKDVEMTLLRRASHSSYCPYKGEAGYFDIRPLGDDGANAVWTYEKPFDAVAEIADHVAFYPNRVTVG